VIVGLAAIVGVVVIGLVLVQRVGTTYRDGLDVATDAASLAADAAGPVGSMTTDLASFASTAETGISQARTVLASAQTSLEQLGKAAEDDLAPTAAGLASLSNRVAGVLGTIEGFIPGNRTSAAEDLRAIADGLAPVPDQLRQLGTQLQKTATELDGADPTLAEVATSVQALGADLERLAPSIAELGTAATRLQQRVHDARDRVGVDLWLARLVVVLLGAVLAIILWVSWRRQPPEVAAGPAVPAVAGTDAAPQPP
jgi:hypothetical protein